MPPKRKVATSNSGTSSHSDSDDDYSPEASSHTLSKNRTTTNKSSSRAHVNTQQTAEKVAPVRRSLRNAPPRTLDSDDKQPTRPQRKRAMKIVESSDNEPVQLPPRKRTTKIVESSDDEQVQLPPRKRTKKIVESNDDEQVQLHASPSAVHDAPEHTHVSTDESSSDSTDSAPMARVDLRLLSGGKYDMYYTEKSKPAECQKKVDTTNLFKGLHVHSVLGHRAIIVNDVLRCIFGHDYDYVLVRTLNSCIHQNAVFKSDKKSILLPYTESTDLSDVGAIVKIDADKRFVYACSYATMSRYVRSLCDVIGHATPNLIQFHVEKDELDNILSQLKVHCRQVLLMDVTDDARLGDEMTSRGRIQALENKAAGSRVRRPANPYLDTCSKSKEKEVDSDGSGFVCNSVEYMSSTSDAISSSSDESEADAALFSIVVPHTDSVSSSSEAKPVFSGRLAAKDTTKSAAARVKHIRRVVRLVRANCVAWCDRTLTECDNLLAEFAHSITRSTATSTLRKIRTMRREVVDRFNRDPI